MAPLVQLLGFATLALLADNTKAMFCIIGQEPDPASKGVYRWVIPVEDPCQCTEVQVGGMITWTPHRPFRVNYYNTFLHSDDPVEIKHWLHCTGEPHTEQSDAVVTGSAGSVCPADTPLGMEDGRIPDSSITASSARDEDNCCGPERARLNMGGVAAAWVFDKDMESGPYPWIQVDLSSTVYVTGVITQGRGDISQWVKMYQVAYSLDGVSWTFVVGEDAQATTFPGNTDRSSLVTHRFSEVLRTRFIRVYPTSWNNYCSMRFEVLGCSA